LLPIINEECVMETNNIFFEFGTEYQTANESDNSNSYLSVIIIYSRCEDLFISFEKDHD